MDTEENVTMSRNTETSKWATARLIIGIICIVLFPLISLQSCAVTVGDAFLSEGDAGGAAGIMISMLIVVSGIVMVVTRKSVKKGASITSCVFLWFCFFLSRMCSGTFSDLRIYGFLAFFFGAFFLVTSMKSKKGFWISLAISVVYFVLGIA